MEAVRLAIVGLGRMGCTIDDEVQGYDAITLPYAIAPAAQACERVDLVAGCDLLAEKREAFKTRYGVAAVYDDVAAMIRAEQPDLVAICTKGPNHAELTIACAELGVRGIYCEKAIGESLAQIEAVKQAVEARDIAFATGVLRRYDPRYQVVRELIANGGIGVVQGAVHYGGTTLLHGHTHSLDTLLWLLGDPRLARIRGDLRQGPSDGASWASDPGGWYQMQTDSGVLCHSVPCGNWEFEVTGSEGVVRTLNNGAQVSLRRKRPVGTRFHELQPVEPPAVTPRSATVVILEELAAALLDGAPLREGIGIAYHVTEGCFAIAESALRGGAWVELPLVGSEVTVTHV